jgi:hypothetical protein
MNFTPTEIQEAIEKLLNTSIRREYGALGNRRSDLTYNDTKNAAAGVFILSEKAPFYVVRLAATRLTQAVESERQLVNEFIDVIRVTGRSVRGVKNLSSLSNAKVALSALASAMSERSSLPADIEEVPAFQRFEQNTQRFLDDVRDAIVSNGAVVSTPDEARAQIGNYFRSLKAAHEDIVRRTVILQSAIEDFSRLALPSLLSQTILDNAQTVLEERVTELEGLTEQQRLKVLRGAVLDILAARSAVRGFSSLSSPTAFHLIDGTGEVFADADHPATPAKLVSDKYGPYPFLDVTGAGVELDFKLDGDVVTTTTVQVQGSFVARIDATVREPFDVGNPNTVGVDNDRFVVGLKNWPLLGNTSLVVITLTTSASKDTFTLANEINADIVAAFPTMPLITEPYNNPLKFKGAVDIDYTPTFGTDADLIAPPGVDFTVFGLEVGEFIRVTDPLSANYGTILIIENIAAGVIGVAQSNPAPPGTDELDKIVEMGGFGMPLRLRITTADDGNEARLAAVNGRYAIFLPEFFGSVTKQEQFDGTTTLGLFPLMEAPSRPVTAQEAATTISGSAQAAKAGVVRLSAEPEFNATLFSGQGRTDPFNFLRAVLFKFRAPSVQVTTLGGNNARFTVAGAVTSGSVVVGDVVAIRSSTTPAEVNLWGAITIVDDTKIEATMNSPVVNESGVEIEVGPNLSSIVFNPTLRVSTSFNDGDYLVRNVKPGSPSFVPFELDLDRPFPFPAGAGNLPVFFTAALGRFRLIFSTTNTTLSSKLVMDNGGGNPKSAVLLFFNTQPKTSFGTTAHLHLADLPKPLEEADQLEYYDTQFNAANFITAIESIDRQLNLIKLVDEQPVNTPVHNFALDTPIPFARIRRIKVNNYEELRTSLTSWLVLNPNTKLYFPELQRLLNAITTNTNPTISQINDPIVKLNSLVAALDVLTDDLEAYDAAVVDEVDTLIEAFTQKGADRAVRFLLEARFSDFFGLDVDQLSYAGTLQKSIRDVERSDLPIRKTNRTSNNAALDALVSSYEEPDFEFNQSDVESEEEVNIP